MRKILIALCGLIFILASCEFEEPDFSDVSNFKFKELNGNQLDFSFDVKVENPNTLGFKVKNGKVDVSGNGLELGTITLNEKIKVKRKSENTYTVPLTLDLTNGGLLKILKLASDGEVEVKLDGKVRGKVLGFGKSIDIHETKKIDGSMFKLPQQ